MKAARRPLFLALLLLASCTSTQDSRASHPMQIPSDRRLLLGDALGFGARARGGADGPEVHVTTLADVGPGSLREALDRGGPLWIVFDVSGEIESSTPLRTRGDTTIDGRGSRVEFAGHGLSLDGVSSVVLENLVFSGGADDAVKLLNGARSVWIDHCSFGVWEDGAIDITLGATDVTVSWCIFEGHDKVMLIGADPDDEMDVDARVTLHHDWFRRTGQRHPRLRYGRVHVFNCLFEDWQSYALGASQGGEILSEGNLFVAGRNARASLVQVGEDPEPGRLRSSGDLLLNGALLVEREPELVFEARTSYAFELEPANDELRARIAGTAGAR